MKFLLIKHLIVEGLGFFEQFCYEEGIAISPQCLVQAFEIGNAFGLQFHSEAMETTVEDWGQIPAYRADLEQKLGSTGANDFKKAVEAQLPIMNREAKMVFDNFLQIVRA